MLAHQVSHRGVDVAVVDLVEDSLCLPGVELVLALLIKQRTRLGIIHALTHVALLLQGELSRLLALTFATLSTAHGFSDRRFDEQVTNVCRATRRYTCLFGSLCRFGRCFRCACRDRWNDRLSNLDRWRWWWRHDAHLFKKIELFRFFAAASGELSHPRVHDCSGNIAPGVPYFGTRIAAIESASKCCISNGLTCIPNLRRMPFVRVSSAV